MYNYASFAQMQRAAVAAQGHNNDEEAQLSSQDDYSYYEEDDEEAQLSSRDEGEYSSSEYSYSFHEDEASQTSLGPPGIIALPSTPVNTGRNNNPSSGRAEDIEAISLLLGSINDPTIKAALKSLIDDPLQTNQQMGKLKLLLGDDDWSAIDILHDGLVYVGFEPRRLNKNNTSRKVVWFKSFYGVEPTTVAAFLSDVRKEYPDIDAMDCFMFLNWLFLYDTYPVLSVRWKRCEEYIGSKLMVYLEKMSKVARKKIVWELAHDIEIGRSLDCTTFMVQEFRKRPSAKWFDYKTHSCGLKYETCMAVHEPRIVRIYGPVEPSMHDITLARGGAEDDADSAIFQLLNEGEKVIADSGYNGEPDKVVTTKEEQSSEFKKFLARAKNRHETVHWRLKAFNILGTRFRHGFDVEETMELHEKVVKTVAGIIQYDYENGHPPFEV